MVIFHVSADEMTHLVQITDLDDSIVVYVTTSQNYEITLERSVPTKLSEGDIHYGTANYKVIGLNCAVGKCATFRLQPLSRAKDVVISIALKYGNQSRTFTYTIPAEEAVSLPIAPVVAVQPVAPESTPVPLPGKSDIIMVVFGAVVILITVIIGISVFQIKRPNSGEK